MNCGSRQFGRTDRQATASASYGGRGQNHFAYARVLQTPRRSLTPRVFVADHGLSCAQQQPALTASRRRHVDKLFAVYARKLEGWRAVAPLSCRSLNEAGSIIEKLRGKSSGTYPFREASCLRWHAGSANFMGQDPIDEDRGGAQWITAISH